MKVTFELPVVHRLRSHIPSGKRSRFVADLISKKLEGQQTALEQAARKANKLRKVNRDMKAWEALNEHVILSVPSVGKDSVAVIDQIRAVDKKRFVNRAGSMRPADLRNLELATKQVLQLP